MKLNTIHHLDFLQNTLPDGCASLIVADPPYFEVKGEFDFGVWESFKAYLADVEKWAAECKRILRTSGSVLWWGHALKIAYTQVILDRYFQLLNNCVWEKIDGQTRRNKPSDQRTWITVTERCLFYSNFSQSENDWKNNNASVYWEGFEPIRLTVRDIVARAGGVAAVAAACGVSGRAVGHWTSKSQWYFPAPENMQTLARMLGGDSAAEFERLRAEFERLRAEFAATHRRPFDLPLVRGGLGMTDVWLYSTEAAVTGLYGHGTGKPPRLTSMMINATTRPGELVVVPFAGSGTECAMAADACRDFVGFDIDAGHVATANKRCELVLSAPKLFN